VTKRLNEVLPYGSDFKITKIECHNHLLKNYCTKLLALAKQTNHPIVVRKWITSNILRFRSDIMKAVEHYLKNELPIQQKIAGMF
jgi:CO dehydrogenase/acetyl-CoA synthase beta subunit